MKSASTVLLLCVGGLLGLGMVTLYSSGMFQKGAHFLTLQLMWAGVGMFVCAAAWAIDYRFWKKFAWVFLLGAIGLLALVVLSKFGIKRNGAHRWLGKGVWAFQPSELAKPAVILFLAYYGERFQRFMKEFWKGLALPGICLGIPVGLIFIEPDRGTMFLLAVVGTIVLLLAGARLFYLVLPLLVLVPAFAYSLLHDPMRLKRIMSWLNPAETKSGVGYQSWQAMLALGAGGPTGLGLGNGRQKLGFVPENQTDFILSVIGEELGLIATLAVVIAFIVFVICGVRIASRARDTFGLLLGSGLTFLIGLQAMINIGVVTSALPNKGLPLPFVSYGGSSLVVMLGCVGILLSIAREAGTEEAASFDMVEPDFVAAR